MKKEYLETILKKTDNKQAKDGQLNKNSIIKKQNFCRPVNILVIDDLYSSGNTLNEVVKLLKTDYNVKKIYCLVMTKTKRGGIN